MAAAASNRGFGRRNSTADGGDVDDRSPSLGAHGRQDELSQRGRAEEVHREDGAGVGERTSSIELLNRARLTNINNADTTINTDSAKEVAAALTA
jgi:hypothetical protein